MQHSVIGVAPDVVYNSQGIMYGLAWLAAIFVVAYGLKKLKQKLNLSEGDFMLVAPCVVIVVMIVLMEFHSPNLVGFFYPFVCLAIGVPAWHIPERKPKEKESGQDIRELFRASERSKDIKINGQHYGYYIAFCILSLLIGKRYIRLSDLEMMYIPVFFLSSICMLISLVFVAVAAIRVLARRKSM